MAEALEAPLAEALEASAGLDDPYEFFPPKTNQPFDEILKYVYKNQSFPQPYFKERTAQYAQHLWEAAEKGFGSGLEIGDEYKAALNKNIWQFAAAKTNAELKHITEALLDKEGKMRTESDFRAEANKIANLHNGTLKTEKDTALRSGQMAYKWKDLQDTKDIFPFAEFDAVIDNRTTDLCYSLHGIVVPADHPFLLTYWPPNHFNCRLNVRKLRRGAPTPDDKLQYPKIDENFKINLAEANTALPLKGGYFKNLDPGIIDPENIDWINPLWKKLSRFGKNGEMKIHERADKNRYQEHIALSETLSRKNHKIDLMPEISSNNIQARRLFYPELSPENKKNPDARFDGELADFKLPETGSKTAIQNSLYSTNLKEAAVCIIRLSPGAYRLRDVFSTLRGSFKFDDNYKNIKTVVIVIDEGHVIIIPRAFTKSKNFYKIIDAL